MRTSTRPWLLYMVLALGLLLVVAPFIWMFLGSVKTQSELLRLPPTWLPEEPTSANYTELFDRLDFPRYFTNSTIVAVVVTVSNLVVCSMLGYALAKLRFAGREKLFVIVLATMMIPASVTVVSLFVLMAALGLVSTYAGLILPTAAGPFGVFLMRQFMQSIPDELLEAARVDGAGEFLIFRRIAVPLAMPAFATLAILTFLGSWNAFLWPLIIATRQERYTLPVALATFARGQFQADYGLLMAGAVVLVIPVLVVFILLQRYFTQGIATTGLKG